MKMTRWVLFLAVCGVAACGSSMSEAPDAPSGAPDAPAAIGPDAAGPIELRVQSFVPPTDPLLYAILPAWAERVEAMAGGRLKVTVIAGNAAGAIALPELHAAVNAGTLDGAYLIPAALFGRSRTAGLFGSGPTFGLDANEMLAWLRHGGGDELYAELLLSIGLDNVISIMNGPMPTQPLGWFASAITNVSSLSGLRYRTIGLSLRLFELLGAMPVNLAGGQIVPAIQAGELDAAEFNNPTSDMIVGLPAVRGTYMTQGHHQPAEYFELVLNKAKLESLPADLQAIIRNAAMAQSAEQSWTAMHLNSRDLAKLKEDGIEVVRTPDSVQRAQLEAWDTILAEEIAAACGAATDCLYRRIVDSQKAWAERIGRWRSDIVNDPSVAFEHYFSP